LNANKLLQKLTTGIEINIRYLKDSS